MIPDSPWAYAPAAHNKLHAPQQAKQMVQESVLQVCVERDAIVALRILAAWQSGIGSWWRWWRGQERRWRAGPIAMRIIKRLHMDISAPLAQLCIHSTILTFCNIHTTCVQSSVRENCVTGASLRPCLMQTLGPGNEAAAS